MKRIFGVYFKTGWEEARTLYWLLSRKDFEFGETLFLIIGLLIDSGFWGGKEGLFWINYLFLISWVFFVFIFTFLCLSISFLWLIPDLTVKFLSYFPPIKEPRLLFEMLIVLLPAFKEFNCWLLVWTVFLSKTIFVFMFFACSLSRIKRGILSYWIVFGTGFTGAWTWFWTPRADDEEWALDIKEFPILLFFYLEWKTLFPYLFKEAWPTDAWPTEGEYPTEGACPTDGDCMWRFSLWIIWDWAYFFLRPFCFNN